MKPVDPLAREKQIKEFRALFGDELYFLLVNGYINTSPGHKLTILRTIKGITQTELAKAVNLSQATISRAETCFEKTPWYALKIIANFLGTTLNDLTQDCKIQTPTHPHSKN